MRILPRLLGAMAPPGRVEYTKTTPSLQGAPLYHAGKVAYPRYPSGMELMSSVSGGYREGSKMVALTQQCKRSRFEHFLDAK